MIFLDTNVILRFLTEPSDEKAAEMATAARKLVEEIEAGRVEATISEVVFHEVCFVLAAKSHYGLDWGQIAEILSPILEMRSLKLTTQERAIYLRALEIAANAPKLESADALILARCEHESHDLATFDRRMHRHHEVSFVAMPI